MTQLLRKWLPFGLVLAAVSSLSGCWHGQLVAPERYTTRGKVVWHGEPVRFAVVNFAPMEQGKGAEVSTPTGADGTFEAETVPGEYEIVLEPWDAARCGALPAGAEPTKIQGVIQTGVVVETKAEDNDLDVQVPDNPMPASDHSFEGK